MSVDETLVCHHSNESYWAVLSNGPVYFSIVHVKNENEIWDFLSVLNLGALAIIIKLSERITLTDICKYSQTSNWQLSSGLDFKRQYSTLPSNIHVGGL